MRTMIIGAGQCGNSLLYLLDKEYLNLSSQQNKDLLEVVYVNLNQKDLIDRMINVDPTHNRYYYAIEQYGTGRDIREGIKLFERNDDRAEALLAAIFRQKRHDEVLLIASAGGGTGSSFTVYFLNKLANEVSKIQNDIRVTAVIIYPFYDEPLNFHANAIILTKNILDVMARLSNNPKVKLTVIPIANTKVQEKKKTTSFDQMNEYISKIILSSSFKLLTEIVQQGDTKHKFFKTLDKAEFSRIGSFAKVFLVDEDDIVKLKLDNDSFFKRATTLHVIKTSPSKSADWYSKVIDKLAAGNMLVLAGEVYAPHIGYDYIITVSNINFKNETELFETLYEAKVDVSKKIASIKQVMAGGKIDADNISKIASTLDI